ncbi:MAG: hypothetical protein PHN42_03265 [Bacilli bacterium]|nr:hypothetical protein [Bacilli bacterium]
MKENINLLFFQNVGNYLDNENIKYLAFEIEEGKYVIENMPVLYNGFLSSLSQYLCYDFDYLSDINKIRYQKFYKSVKKVDNNIYSVQTKKYVINKERSFT